jgi:hypothetical protein
MPPRALKRQYRPSGTIHTGELPSELREFMLTGKRPSEFEGASHEVCAVSWDGVRMSALWRAHRRVLLDEAKRRRITAYYSETEDAIVPTSRFPSVLVEVDDPRCVLAPGRCHAKMLVSRHEVHSCP